MRTARRALLLLIRLCPGVVQLAVAGGLMVVAADALLRDAAELATLFTALGALNALGGVVQIARAVRLGDES